MAVCGGVCGDICGDVCGSVLGNVTGCVGNGCGMAVCGTFGDVGYCGVRGNICGGV